MLFEITRISTFPDVFGGNVGCGIVVSATVVASVDGAGVVVADVCSLVAAGADVPQAVSRRMAESSKGNAVFFIENLPPVCHYIKLSDFSRKKNEEYTVIFVFSALFDFWKRGLRLCDWHAESQASCSRRGIRPCLATSKSDQSGSIEEVIVPDDVDIHCVLGKVIG